MSNGACHEEAWGAGADKRAGADAPGNRRFPGILCFSRYAQRLRDHEIFRFGPPSAGVPLDFSAAPRYNETILEKDGEHHES